MLTKNWSLLESVWIVRSDRFMVEQFLGLLFIATAFGSTRVNTLYKRVEFCLVPMTAVGSKAVRQISETRLLLFAETDE